MEHSPGLLQDTKSLRSGSGNRAKVLLKVILELNVTPNITRSLDSLSTVPPIINGGDWGCIVRDLETIIVLVSRIQFHSPKVTPLTNPAKVTDQGLCDCNSNAWGCHNSHQSSPQHNRSAYFPEWKIAPKCTGGTITVPKHCHAALLIQRQPAYSDNHPP